VGLIYYRNLSRSGDWFMLEPAKKQKRDPGEREALRHLFEGEVNKSKQTLKKKRFDK
jgi:hypothetical protein